MKKTLIRNILTSFLVLIVCLCGFYKFMTYDRNYTWTKEFDDEIKSVAKSFGFYVIKTDRISVVNIKLPTERAIKIRIQKFLSQINLMNYDQEFGQNSLLITDNTNELLNCKGWCLGDHLIGIEIEYKNIHKDTLKNLKDSFEKQFDNYKIIWTHLTDK